ncbi:sarcosine oxidase subunit gamma [Millisia brevis]|uniref:sarcosine oxidase subunit gamma n=1 Tax=Millisia brevis TaxID=264148 RepID=UPI000A02AEC1|nr:sarcosine oxidase subunit gamma family protein [Millisia brevis]
MASSTPTAQRRSPLDGRAPIVRSERISIVEVPFAAQLTVQAFDDIAGLPVPGVGEVRRDGDTLVAWLGPQEWLVVREDIAPWIAEAELVAAIGDAGAVVDTSGQRTILEISGPAARTVLMMGSSIDLHPDVFGSDRVVQTDLARANVILYRTADPDTFRVLVRASFARYLADWLADAAVEYLEPEGARG